MLKYSKKILKDLEAALKIAEKVKEIYNAILIFAEIIREWIAGRFKVPLSKIAIIAATLAYIVTPFDIIPDFIPFVGYIDDTAAVAFAIEKLRSVIDDFNDYLRAQGKPVYEVPEIKLPKKYQQLFQSINKWFN